MTPGSQKAYLFTRSGLELRDDIPIPEIRPGFLLLKIMGVSICGTDIGMLKGDAWTQENVYPCMSPDHVLGHEFFGEVVAAGSGTFVKAGTIGACESHYPCPTCMEKGIDGHTCEHYGIYGVWGHSEGGKKMPLLGGAFSEYALVPESNFYDVGDLHKTFHCSLIEPCGNTWMIMEDLTRRASIKTLLIIGSGPHGLNLQCFADYFGVKTIVAVEPNDFRRGYARGLGAAHMVLRDLDSLTPEKLGEIAPGGFDAVLDVVGYKSVMDKVLSSGLVKEGGILGLFGLPKEHGRTVSTKAGDFLMNDFIFQRMEADIGSIHAVGYTGRTDHAMKTLIKALRDGERGRRLQELLSRQLRIAGPLDELDRMIKGGFPGNMEPEELKIGFTGFR